MVGAAGGEGFINVLTEDEMSGQLAQGESNAAPDQRIAGMEQGGHGLPGRGRLAGQFAQGGEQGSGAGGAVDQQRMVAVGMPQPVAARHFFVNQGVDRGRLGDAQRSLGQAHQGTAFRAGQREGMHQFGDRAAAAGGGAQRFEQFGGEGRRGWLGWGECAEQGADTGGFRLAASQAHGLAQALQVLVVGCVVHGHGDLSGSLRFGRS